MTDTDKSKLLTFKLPISQNAGGKFGTVDLLVGAVLSWVLLSLVLPLKRNPPQRETKGKDHGLR